MSLSEKFYAPNFFFLQKMYFKTNLTLYQKELYITLMCYTFASVQAMRREKGRLCTFGEKMFAVDCPHTYFKAV